MVEALFLSLEENEQYVGRLRGSTKVEGEQLQPSSDTAVVHLCTRSVLVEFARQRVVKYLFKHMLTQPALGKFARNSCVTSLPDSEN